MSESYLKKVFARNDSVVSRQIADEVILVPIKKRAGEVDSIYTINEVAGRIWELIDGTRDVAAIRDALVEEFDVAPDTAGTDLVDFMRQLQQADAIREV